MVDEDLSQVYLYLSDFKNMVENDLPSAKLMAALKNVIETINDIRTGNDSLITVVGCGGDRDKRKRNK